jgi:DNA-binding SARP family transcriptional activator
VRLTEQRSRAQERRAELALTAQGGAAVVAELEAPVREHPVREESWRLLALALYDAGRQGDAPAALRRIRQVLTDELGLNADSHECVVGPDRSMRTRAEPNRPAPGFEPKTVSPQR